MTFFFGYVGRITLNALFAFLLVCELIVDTGNWLIIQPVRGKGLRWRSAVEQFVEFGARSMPIVGLISFLVGGHYRITIGLHPGTMGSNTLYRRSCRYFRNTRTCPAHGSHPDNRQKRVGHYCRNRHHESSRRN